MDEMTSVRELREDAPRPDRARLAPGRQRLNDALESGAYRRRLRNDWRITSVGAAAAVAAAVLLATQLPDDSSDSSDRTASPAGIRAEDMPDLSDVPDLLRRAAETAADKPDPKPRDGQWTYEQTYLAPIEGVQMEPRQESWTRYADPAFENGREGDDHSPREVYRFLQDLPDHPQDPGPLFEKAREFYPDDPEATRKQPEDEHNYGAARVLLDAYPAPPEGMARVLRALAELEGMTAVDHLVKDAKGRPAIALYLEGSDEYGSQAEILLDPKTLDYVGTRTIVTRDMKPGEMPGSGQEGGGEDSGPPPLKKGQIMHSRVTLHTALVSKEGERPAGVPPLPKPSTPPDGYRIETVQPEAPDGAEKEDARYEVWTAQPEAPDSATPQPPEKDKH